MRPVDAIKEEIADYEGLRAQAEGSISKGKRDQQSTSSAEAQVRYCDEVLPPLRAELQQRIEADQREAASKKAQEEHARALMKPEKPLAEAEKALEPFAAALDDARAHERAKVKILADCEAEVSRANDRRSAAQGRKPELSGEARKALLHQIAALNLEADDAIEQRNAAKKALDEARAIVAAAIASHRQAEADVKFWSAAVVSNRARQKTLAFLADIAPDVMEVSKLARASRELVKRPGALFGEGGLTRIFPDSNALPEVRDFSHWITSAASGEEVQRIVDDMRASVQKQARKAGAR